MDFSLFQKHTLHLYDLASHPYRIHTVKARSLLSVHRFDLFAKLFYARHRENEFQLAQEVYLKHIKAFNPDGKEPGRTDKVTFDDFLKTFDDLLFFFKDNDFDATKSIVPVSCNNIILDGAHRIAALAFYDKEVTIATFEDVYPACQFDYDYFKKRGLSQFFSDIIAREILYWMPNCFVACIWPRTGTAAQKEFARQALCNFSVPYYHKAIKVNLKSLTFFIAKVYHTQAWVGTEENKYAGARDKALNCYSKRKVLDFYFFCTSKALEDILRLKEQIRNLYPYDKHSIHITDNGKETEDIAYYALSSQGLGQWLYTGKWKGWKWLEQNIVEYFYIFTHTYWIDFKVCVVSLLNKMRNIFV